MALLPTLAHLTDAARLKTEAATDIGSMRDVIAQIGGSEAWAAGATLTIASGSITPTMNLHRIETQGAASTDDLTNIATTNLPEGHRVRIRATTLGRTVVVKHGSGGIGKIYLANDADYTLDTPDKYLDLVNEGGDWYEVGRCWGSDRSSSAFKAFYGQGTAAALDVGTAANKVVQFNASAQYPANDGSLITGLRQRGLYLKVTEKQAAGVSAGASIAGWNKRSLNTLAENEIPSGVSLASGQLTLPAGTYYFQGSAPAYNAGVHKLSLYETTVTIARIYGQVCYCAAGGYDDELTHSSVCGKFIIAVAKTFELQHFITYPRAGDGLGKASAGTSGEEIYTQIELWKVA
jgi:hypothetical protein